MYIGEFATENSPFMFIYKDKNNFFKKQSIKERPVEQRRMNGGGKREGKEKVLRTEMEQIIFHMCRIMSK